MKFEDSNLAELTVHATLVFERDVPATVEDVFVAFADAKARTQWGPASAKDAIVYDQEEFREEGLDRFRCGPKESPTIHGRTRYLEIIPNRRIVSSETISIGGQRLCASLTTVELRLTGNTTKLKSTTQLASFVGHDMIRGHENGYNGALDNLVRFVAER